MPQGNVVVLDQNRVEESDAMIHPAAAADTVFLQRPPAGRRLAGVENLRPRAGDGIERRGRHAERYHATAPLVEAQPPVETLDGGQGSIGGGWGTLSGSPIVTPSPIETNRGGAPPRP